MTIRLIGAFLSTLIVYAIAVNMAVNETEKVYVKLNKFFKIIFGFWVYKTNRFGLKSIIFQTGNIISAIMAITILLTYNNLNLAFKYQGIVFLATLAVTGVVSIFVNRW